MKSLKEQIRDHEIGCLYLFYGEERYLVRLNTERLKKALMSEEDEMMNLDDLTSPTDFEVLRASIETFPFMTEKRLVIIRDSHMFGGKGVASLEKLPELMEEIPSTTTVLFIENEVDKIEKASTCLAITDSVLYSFYRQENEQYPFTPIEKIMYAI